MASAQRYLLTALLAAQGVAHLLFIGPLLGGAAWSAAGDSWLLTPLAGHLAALLVGGPLWIAAAVAFAVAAFGVYADAPWTRRVSIAAALISLAGLLLFWLPVPPLPMFLVFVGDLTVLSATVWFHPSHLAQLRR